MVTFPKHDDAWYRSRLALPVGRPRVVIDTDTANEIDDQFALAWALLSQDKLQIDGVYAEPFSFEHRRHEMIRARNAAQNLSSATPEEIELHEQYAGMLSYYAVKGWQLETLDWPPFNSPAVGMERSYQEILTVFDKMNEPTNGRVFRGSAGYLPAIDQPLHSESVDHLIATARAMPDDQPLYVVAIGCVTNIASALLLAPDIIEKMVVIWTSGYPSHAPQTNFSLNMEQDMPASKILLDSGVPHIYLPGFHVGAQLRLSLPEMQEYVKGRGEIGDYLHHLYTHNPLWDFLGINSFYAYTWTIWDVINIAWLLNPAWVPSDLVRTPILGDDRRWHHDATRHLMREAYAVNRDAIFKDFFQKLDAAAVSP